MSLTSETQELVNRLAGLRARAQEQDVRQVLEAARAARLRAQPRGEAAASLSAGGGGSAARPWGARAEEARARAALLAERGRAVKAPRAAAPEEPDELARGGAGAGAGAGGRPARRPAKEILAALASEQERARGQPAPLPAGDRRAAYANREHEKRRLQLQFQFKGGKALPESALPAPSEGLVPVSLITRRTVQRGPEHEARAERARAGAAYDAHRARLDDLHASFGQVMAEVEAVKRSAEQARTAKARADLGARLSQLLADANNIEELINDEQRMGPLGDSRIRNPVLCSSRGGPRGLPHA
jgi:hypothetical protein